MTYRVRKGDRVHIPSDSWSLSFAGGVSIGEANRLLEAIFRGSVLHAAAPVLALLTSVPVGDAYDELELSGLHRSTLSLTRQAPARLANLSPCAWGTPGSPATVTHLAALDPDDGRLRYFAPAQASALVPGHPLTAAAGALTLSLA